MKIDNKKHKVKAKPERSKAEDEHAERRAQDRHVHNHQELI